MTSLSLIGCAHDLTSPSAELTAVAPDLVCNGSAASSSDGATRVELSGADFTPMPSRTLADPRRLLLPKVTLGPVAALPGGTLPATPIAIADDPASPQTSRVHWTSEASMSFDVAPADALAAGVFDVTITNPDGKHASTLAQHLALIPPPIVTAAQPMAICDDQADQTVVITGTNFLVFDGTTPKITITTPTGAKTYASTFAAADCMAIAGTFTETHVALCSAISFVIPVGDIPVTANTMMALVVTNPPPADCASSTAFQVTIDAPPTVDSVAPATVCEGGGQLTINGGNFAQGATVVLHCPGVDVAATTVVVNAGGAQIAATFGGGALPGATCEVIVTNPDSCDDRPLPHKTVGVTTGPIAFFVDPEVVYNGINTRITIYSTTITPTVQFVDITLGGVQTSLTFNAVPGFPNRLQAIVPINQPPGTYDLTLEDGSNCPTTLPAALTVTATTSVTLKKVTPPFGDTAKDTAVTITRDSAAVAPNDHPFVETPRVFLNPHAGATTDIAVPLESVAFLDGDHVTGIVPAGTPVHVYDVVLVNPDGTVGVLPSGYTETATAPPEIDGATPASIVDATGQKVTLAGTGFGAGDVVTLACLTAAGVAETAPAVTSTAATCTAGACTQAITINGSGLAAGSVCVVRITNADGTYGEFSAIGVTNSSLNLNSPKAGAPMTVGRRALAAASGNATAAARFVYAIGGDNGTIAGALDSVEFAPVDVFGNIGTWSVQPNHLGGRRTLGGAVTVGRYIYLVGGNAGSATGQTTTAERALILSPQEAPEITDVDLKLATAGLDPGEYHYRVSAMSSAADPDNPSGESLASDEFTIKVPAFPGKKVALTLIWRAPVDALGAALPDIASYKVYRTATNGAPGTEVLLGTTAGATPRTFVDDGSAALGTTMPLPLGTTGKWAALTNLGTKREGLAVAWARDPVVPTTFYVYALLGRDSATTATTSYEYLTVTTAGNGRQTASLAWTPGGTAAATARWQAGAWTVNAAVSSLYAAPATYVFVGGGLDAAGGSVSTVEAAPVAAGGLLGTFDATPRDFGVSRAGYGVCAANDQLFTFGGLNGAPSKGAQSATLSSPVPSLAAGAWNNEGLMMTHGRYLMGSAVQSSFIFLLGGQTDEVVGGAASTTTELVIW